MLPFLTCQAAESWMQFSAKRSPVSEGVQSGCVLGWCFSTEVIDLMPGDSMDLFHAEGIVFHASSWLVYLLFTMIGKNLLQNILLWFLAVLCPWRSPASHLEQERSHLAFHTWFEELKSTCRSLAEWEERLQEQTC